MSLTRDVTTVGSATLMSRAFALARDIGVAAILGAGPLSDAYFAALQIPNLFRRLLSEGALNGALVPMWLRLHARDRERVRGFGERTFGVVLMTLGGFALICAVFAPAVIHIVAPGFAEDGERFGAAVVFLRWSIGYVAVAGLSAVAAAILNAQGRVAAAAGSVAVFNLVLVGAVVFVIFLGTGRSRQSGTILTLSFAIAGLVQFALLAVALSRLRDFPRRPRFALSPDMRRFAGRAIPAVIAAGIPALAFIAGTIIVSSSAAAVSWLYYAYRLYEVPLGIVSVAVAAVLAPRIAASIHAGDTDGTATTQSRALEIALGLGLPAAIGLALLAQPIAGVLFERGAFTAGDTSAVAIALVAIAAGLPGHGIEKVLAATCFAREEARTPMFTALFGLLVTIVGGLLLFPRYGHAGVAAAVGGAGWSSSLMLAVILRRRRWLSFSAKTAPRILGIVAASTLMAAALMLGLYARAHVLTGVSVAITRVLTLAVLIPLGLAVYLFSLRLFGIVHVGELVAAARHRT